MSNEEIKEIKTNEVKAGIPETVWGIGYRLHV